MTEGQLQDSTMLDQAIAYWTDAWQRSVLTLEALNERGNIHLAQATKDVPNVLNFAVELILDGREFERPVNYGLVRILPPEGAAIDPAKPPIVVVDPRAGHVPGIGGMKPDSEIGVATHAPVTLAISSASRPSRCRVRRSRTSAAPKRFLSKRSPAGIRTPTAGRSLSPIARRVGKR
jgi:hypothetical protein